MGRQPTLVVSLLLVELPCSRGPMSKRGRPELSKRSWAIGCIFPDDFLKDRRDTRDYIARMGRTTGFGDELFRGPGNAYCYGPYLRGQGLGCTRCKAITRGP